MTDIEFAFSFSPEIGKYYKTAKDYSVEIPDYALISLRSLCKLICKRVRGDNADRDSSAHDLRKEIDALADIGRISSRMKSVLHQLRTDGNKGAHPEEQKLTQAQLGNICTQSLVVARQSLELLHSIIHPGEAIATYITSTSGHTDWKEISFDAVINCDDEARYVLGNRFKAEVEKLSKDPTGNARYIDLPASINQMVFWYKLAAESGHVAAMFEYGLCLLEGTGGERLEGRGASFVYRSSRDGNADAHALLGDCLLHGVRGFEVDLEEARHHFEVAAADDHPAALSNLGAMYFNGLGGPVDRHGSIRCIRKAAEAGYPAGQYNLFVQYSNGFDVEKDTEVALSWLKKSADQAYPPGMFALASLINYGELHDESRDKAESLFEQCLVDPDLSSKAAYELACIRGAGTDLEKLISAANLLQQCFEKEDRGSELAKKCWSASPTVVRRIREALRPIGVAQSLYEASFITLNYFDDDDHPVESRQQKNSELFESLKKATGSARAPPKAN